MPRTNFRVLLAVPVAVTLCAAPLFALLCDSSPRVRITAAEGLERFGPAEPGVVRALVQSLAVVGESDYRVLKSMLEGVERNVGAMPIEKKDMLVATLREAQGNLEERVSSQPEGVPTIERKTLAVVRKALASRSAN